MTMFKRRGVVVLLAALAVGARGLGVARRALPAAPRRRAAQRGAATDDGQRPPRSHGTASATSSVFNLAKNIIGSGVLALPGGVAAFSNSPLALYPTLALIVALGASSAYCFILVGRACAALGTRTYRGAWERGVDETSGWVVTAVCAFKTLSACLAYCIIIGDTGTSLAATFLAGRGGGLAALATRRDVFLAAVGALILFPLAILKSLAALAPASVLGLAGMLYTTAVVAWRALDGSYATGGALSAALVAERKALPAFGTATSAPASLVLVSMLATAYVAHYNAARFYDELADPRQFNGVAFAGFGLAVAVFALLTAAGFRTFGGNAAGMILNSYAASDGLATAARAAVGVSVACTYPLLFAGLRDYVYEFAPRLRSRRTALTAALVALSVAAGIAVRDLGFVIAFGGAIMGSAIIYIIPTKIILTAHRDGKLLNNPLSSLEASACRFIHVLGWLLAALGGAVCIAKQFFGATS